MSPIAIQAHQKTLQTQDLRNWHIVTENATLRPNICTKSQRNVYTTSILSRTPPKTTEKNLFALTGYQRRFGIEEMFRDFKSGGYNLEGTAVRGQRLIGLILIITLAYSSATMSGEKIKRQGVVK